jgi:hypothetical protein
MADEHMSTALRRGQHDRSQRLGNLDILHRIGRPHLFGLPHGLASYATVETVLKCCNSVFEQRQGVDMDFTVMTAGAMRRQFTPLPQGVSLEACSR